MTAESLLVASLRTHPRGPPGEGRGAKPACTYTQLNRWGIPFPPHGGVDHAPWQRPFPLVDNHRRPRLHSGVLPLADDGKSNVRETRDDREVLVNAHDEAEDRKSVV